MNYVGMNHLSALMTVASLLAGLTLVPRLEAFQTFDHTKWNSSADIRVQEIEGGSALFGVARKAGVNSGTSNFTRTVGLTFADQNCVNAIEATVTALDAALAGNN